MATSTKTMLTIDEFRTMTGLVDFPEYHFKKVQEIYDLTTKELDDDTFGRAYAQLCDPKNCDAIELVEDLALRAKRTIEMAANAHGNYLDCRKKLAVVEADLEVVARKLEASEGKMQEAADKMQQLMEANDGLDAKLWQMADAMIKGGLEEQAVEILGRRKVVAIKAASMMSLSADDLAFIAQELGR